MVKGHQHGVLHLVVPAAIAAGTLLTWFELHLEFNEVVLLAWTILGPLHAQANRPVVPSPTGRARNSCLAGS